jgi:hypothetical protein
LAPDRMMAAKTVSPCRQATVSPSGLKRTV